jgi:DNA-directed RNA polymerase specialized sigma24 family protein
MNQAVKPELHTPEDNRLRPYLLTRHLDWNADHLEQEIFADATFNDALDATEFELLRDAELGVLTSSEHQKLEARLLADPILRARRQFVAGLIAAVQRSIEHLGREIDLLTPVLMRFFRSRRPDLAEDLASEVKVRALQKARGLPLSGEDLRKYLHTFAGLIALEVGRDRLRAAGTSEDLERLVEGRSMGVMADEERQLLSADALRRCSQVLGDAEFRILVHYWAGDRRALARKLNVASGALRVRVHRLIKQLKTALGQ